MQMSILSSGVAGRACIVFAALSLSACKLPPPSSAPAFSASGEVTHTWVVDGFDPGEELSILHMRDGRPVVVFQAMPSSQVSGFPENSGYADFDQQMEQAIGARAWWLETDRLKYRISRPDASTLEHRHRFLTRHQTDWPALLRSPEEWGYHRILSEMVDELDTVH